MSRARPEDAGKILSDRLVAIMQRLKVPNGLRSIGYAKSDIPALVQGTLPQARVTKLSPRPADEADLAHLFEESLGGLTVGHLRVGGPDAVLVRHQAAQGLGLQGHLRPAGQVKAESYLEPVLPLGRREQLRAEHAQHHGHDEHQQKHERPSRMRDGSRWGCHFSACLRSAVSRKPSCRTAAQCTLSLSDLARSS